MEYDSMSNKKELRAGGLLRRERLSAEEVEEKSTRIVTRLMQLEIFRSCRFIMVYMDFRNEVATGALIRHCLEQGKRVALPKVIKNPGERGCLWACEIRSLEQDLESGVFGVTEPKSERLKKIEEKDLDLIIVPGVVFGENRYRIGYGAGYYDGFLKNCSRECRKVGVAFEAQVVEKVPFEEHDIPLDIIVTENRII